MSKLQFIALLTPSIGSFVLLMLAWMFSNARLSDLKESMNARFADVNGKIAEARDESNRRFGEVNRQFDEVNRRLGLIEADQKQFYNVTGKLDGRLEEISRR